MGVKIITDSTADLPRELIQKYDIEVLPLMVNFGDKSYRDGVDITPGQFYEMLAGSKILPTTSQVNPPAFVSAYQRALDNGDAVISIHLSSKGSGTYQSAVIARDIIGSDRIFVIDSLGYSMGIGLIALAGARLARAGIAPEEIEKELLDLRDRMNYVFGVDTLEYLKKGGRLSPAKATIATVMNIKPILEVRNGELEVLDKVRGKKKALNRIIQIAREKSQNMEDKTVAIVHAACEEDAVQFRDMVVQEFNPGEVIVSEIGCVIGTHAGPGTIAIMFA